MTCQCGGGGFQNLEACQCRQKVQSMLLLDVTIGAIVIWPLHDLSHDCQSIHGQVAG